MTGGGCASIFRLHYPRPPPPEKNATPAQLAIAWVRSRGDDIIPLIGARRREQLRESLAALAVKLSPEELARIEAAVPPEAVQGTRYDAHSIKMLDSERG